MGRCAVFDEEGRQWIGRSPGQAWEGGAQDEEGWLKTALASEKMPIAGWSLGQRNLGSVLKMKFPVN